MSSDDEFKSPFFDKKDTPIKTHQIKSANHFVFKNEANSREMNIIKEIGKRVTFSRKEIPDPSQEQSNKKTKKKFQNIKAYFDEIYKGDLEKKREKSRKRH